VSYERDVEAPRRRIDELESELASLRLEREVMQRELTELRQKCAWGAWGWLKSTYRLQREVYDFQLPLPAGTDELADYVVMNHSALVAEATELLSEFGWKSWAKPRGWVNRENALKEAVDVAHFLANIVCAIGITDDEWRIAYQAKQDVNRKRQVDGYDGVTGKCPGCKRSYDDGIDCRASATVNDITAPAWCAARLQLYPPQQPKE
jgi:hypothetical protein